MQDKMKIYDLEIYDKGYVESEHWYFSQPLSPQQMLDFVLKQSNIVKNNTLYGELYQNQDMNDEQVERFYLKLSRMAYLFFDEIRLHDSLLEN